jgi:hypothetical protein
LKHLEIEVRGSFSPEFRFPTTLETLSVKCHIFYDPLHLPDSLRYLRLDSSDYDFIQLPQTLIELEFEVGYTFSSYDMFQSLTRLHALSLKNPYGRMFMALNFFPPSLKKLKLDLNCDPSKLDQLPAGLEVLRLDTQLDNESIQKIPRNVKKLHLENPHLTFECLSYLPPNLTYLGFPHHM